MSTADDVLIVQVGQCGVTAGAALSARICARHDACMAQPASRRPRAPLDGLLVRRGRADTPSSRAAADELVPRAVSVDAEPKAMHDAHKAHTKPVAAVWTEGGRGGVFANGFARDYGGGGARGLPQQASSARRGGESGVNLLSAAMAAVRAWAESSATTPDVLLLHSLAGGTGSGLGTRLLETMRDDGFHKAFVVTASVVPLACGESPIQAVNATLSLSSLAENADAALLLRNDDAVRAATRAREPGMQGANAYLAALLERTLAAHGRGVAPLRDIVTECAPIPAMKFLDAHTSWRQASQPSSSLSSTPPWREVLKAHLAPLVCRTHVDGTTPIKSISSMAFAHGTESDAGEALATLQASRTYTHAAWQTDPWRTRSRPLPLLAGEARHLTVISNRSNAIDVLEGSARRTRALLRAGAFVHHYTPFGVDKEDWEHACHVAETTSDAYRAFYL